MYGCQLKRLTEKNLKYDIYVQLTQVSKLHMQEQPAIKQSEKLTFCIVAIFPTFLEKCKRTNKIRNMAPSNYECEVGTVGKISDYQSEGPGFNPRL